MSELVRQLFGEGKLIAAHGEAMMWMRERFAKGQGEASVIDIKAEVERLDNYKKAFLLACKYLNHFAGCPGVYSGEALPECDGGLDDCGAHSTLECWQKFLLSTVENQAVCRECGCTDDFACEGGCHWVEPDLCSSCAGEGKEDD